MMGWQLIELKDVAPSPWRNGGGLTRELLAWPNPRDWVWRVSVAEVARSGPFSRFEGVRRWFAVLAGAGVHLDVAGQAHELTTGSVPLCFDGAAPVDCRLLGGATQDFNLMLRRDLASARLEKIPGPISFDIDRPMMVAIYANRSAATVSVGDEVLTLPAHSLVWRAVPVCCTFRVESADALWMEIEV